MLPRLTLLTPADLVGTTRVTIHGDGFPRDVDDSPLECVETGQLAVKDLLPA